MSDQTPERIYLQVWMEPDVTWCADRMDAECASYCDHAQDEPCPLPNGGRDVEYRRVDPPTPGATHWVGCHVELGHHECAVAEVQKRAAEQAQALVSLREIHVLAAAVVAERDALRAKVAKLEADGRSPQR